MQHTDLSSYLQSQIPVLVPCFNNQTYCRNMLAQLTRLGFANIILLDNNSTDPDMQSFLHTIDGTQATVIFQGRNLGPRHCVQDADSREFLPQYFCVTDPDLQFNPDLPADWLAQMIQLTEKYQVGKAGFALDLSEPDLMQDYDIDIHGRKFKIWQWEAQYYQNQLGTMPTGDPVYDAKVDTTFAVYNKKYLKLDHTEQFYTAVRVAGDYTCKHLPWYKQVIVPESELNNYWQTGAEWASQSQWIKK
jgi:hypothetical protein